MSIFLIFLILFLSPCFIFSYIKTTEKEKNIREKEKTKNQVKDFTLKFIEPLIKDNVKYQLFNVEDILAVKNIYFELFKKEISNSSYWTKYDSWLYLKDTYYNKLYEKFMGEFIDNAQLKITDDWEVIKEKYIEVFYEDLRYIPYIITYLVQNEIYTTFIKTENNIKNNILECIRKKSIEKDTIKYKELMDNNQKYQDRKITINDIDIMEGLEFEEYLKSLFVSLGYSVYLTKGSGDQGADLIIQKFGKKTVVQAKCYTNNVSNKAIQEAVAAINYYQADGAMVITNSFFTASAIELARANKVELRDRQALSYMIDMANGCENIANEK